MAVSDHEQPEVIVVGGGLAGLVAALALSSARLRVALIAAPAQQDGRTTALLSGSVTALETLGVWEQCREQAAALTAIRIIDDRGSLFRGPEVAFQADDLGLAAFGFNVPNAALRAALEARAAEIGNLERNTERVTMLACDGTEARIVLESGRILAAPVVVAADGRDSVCRRAAGIAADTWVYPQTALTCAFAHTRPHRGESTEFHTGEGPFTLVPLPGARSSLVWVMAPGRAEALAAASDRELAREIERQSRGILGKIEIEGGRQAFPLAGMSVARLGHNRVALVGEAAHLIPPIGAQGFNLGLRDAASIAEIVVDASRAGGDLGAPELLARYDAQRRPDVASRTGAVDLLNRSLLTSFLPAQSLRGVGLLLLDRIGPLRRAVMRAGLGPGANAPRLMRGEAL